MCVAAAIAGAAVVGGVVSAHAASQAADAQVRASRNAISAQQQAEGRALALAAPQREAGYRATAALMDMTGLSRGAPTGTTYNQDGSVYNPEIGTHTFTSGTPGRAQGEPGNLADYPSYNFQQDPGYDFRLSEGVRALQNSASARGGLLSGGFGRSAIRYAQDYASNEYQNVFNRISTIAGYGNSATAAGATTIVNTGANVGNALINAGEARASGYIASGNAWSNAANQIGSYYGYSSGRGSSSQLDYVFPTATYRH